MPERIVSVMRFEQVWREPPAEDGASARAAYEIDCSSGTYVRSLIADLGGDAYCEQLRRTAIGPFEVQAAVAPPERGAQWSDPPLIGLREALETIDGYLASRTARPRR
jgi:tRNA pseudouridine55 synthase